LRLLGTFRFLGLFGKLSGNSLKSRKLKKKKKEHKKMSARLTNKDISGDARTPIEDFEALWFQTNADPLRLLTFGFRLSGGGAHQSKTMMLKELEALLAGPNTTGNELKHSAIEENRMGKSTANTRRLTFRHMCSLYGFMEQPPLTKVFLKLWSYDTDGHRLQALLIALARDPI
jgi:hypothetical protein